MAIAPRRKFTKRKVLTGGKTEYRAWKDWEEGDKIVCKLISKQPNKKYKNKVDYVVEPIEVDFTSSKETKRIMNAERVTLNSMGQLDKAMKQVEEGDEIEIVYNGVNTIEGGDWEGHESHTCEVSLLGDGSEEDEDLDEEDEEEESEEELDEDEEEEEEAPKKKSSISKKSRYQEEDEDEEEELDEDEEEEEEEEEIPKKKSSIVKKKTIVKAPIKKKRNL